MNDEKCITCEFSEVCENELVEFTCDMCNGSGEGSHDGSTCNFCRGTGATFEKCSK